MLVVVVVAAMFLAQQSMSPELTSVDSPAMVAARENVKRVKTPVALHSSPSAEIPEAARMAGEFGKVVVAGIIGVDGRFTELAVSDSSRSETLDATALAMAGQSIFEPARDEAGQPLAVRARMPFDFSNAHSPGKGGGALRYKCDQVVRDYNWWFKTWPTDKHDDFYLLVLGLTSIARARGADGSIDYDKFATNNKDFDQRWLAAIDTCRSKPNKIFIDVFKPEGDLLRSMAGG